MKRAIAYMSEDRRRAFASGRELARKALGSVLFVDISGFTPLTEALVAQLGRRAGAGAATRHLNAIYTLLIDEIHRYGGSIVGFSGDGMLCWFGADRMMPADAAQHGLAAACAVQTRIRSMATVQVGQSTAISLAAKTALTSGCVARFVVGNPEIQSIDVLAGATVDRAGIAEQVAQQGEIVLDAASVQLTRTLLESVQWRTSNQSLAVVSVADQSAFLTSTAIDDERTDDVASLPGTSVASWLLPAVRQGFKDGQERYLGELRPAVALFVRFVGLDYDADMDAPRKLDAYICWVQSVLQRYEGALIQLTTGDKGSYLYAAFGAPVAHDDDVLRAAAAARALLNPLLTLPYRPVPQMGLAAGHMRVGAYGSDSRCTYGVQGAAVNLAARLMIHADPGVICTDRSTADLMVDRYAVDEAGTIRLKGHSAPLPVWTVGARKDQMPAPDVEWFGVPLRGRGRELAEMEACWKRVRRTGTGAILCVEGDAGLGKSHLIAEFLARAKQPEMLVAGAVCQSTEQNTAYSAARQIACRLLGLGPQRDVNEQDQIDHVQRFLSNVNPAWLPRMPLLGDLLGLPIDDNELTATFDARLRREALADLTVDIVVTAANATPLMVLIDDWHWIDEASLGLLRSMARAAERSPLLLIVAQRPQMQAPDGESQMLDDIENPVRISLTPLSDDAAGLVMQDRLGAAVAPLAGALIQARGQGNPLTLETIVDVLHESAQLVYHADHGWSLSAAALDALRRANLLDESGDEPRLQGDAGALDLGVPDSIHGIVLARLDRLSAEHKLTLKVAGVLGRTFSLELLAAAHPLGADTDLAQRQTTALIEGGFLRLEPGRPHMLQFRHNVAQEVLYQTLLDEQRRDLHLLAARAIESSSGHEAASLAHHYFNAHIDREEVRDKSLHFLDLAAERAQRDYANETALHHVDRALTLEESWPRLLRRVDLLHLLGRRDEEVDALERLACAPDRPDFEVAFARGAFFEATSRYDEAASVMENALAGAQQMSDAKQEAAALVRLGHIVWRRGDYTTATEHYHMALNILGNEPRYANEEADARYGLGLVYRQQGQYGQARAQFDRALAIYRRLGHRPNEAKTLIAIGHVEHYRHNLAAAMAAYQAALPLYRSTGDRAGIGYNLFSLAQGFGSLGDHGRSQEMLLNALHIYEVQHDIWYQSLIWNELGIVFMMVGNWTEAEEALHKGLEMSRQLDDKIGIAYRLCNLGQVLQSQGRLGEAVTVLEAGQQIAAEHNDTHLEALCLQELALTYLRMDKHQDALFLASKSSSRFERLSLAGSNIPNDTIQAAVHLNCGENTLARAAIERARSSLKSDAGRDATFPQREHWICGKMLIELGEDAIAEAAFEDAARTMHEEAERISDVALRSAYLHNHDFNREIAAFAYNASARTTAD